MLAKLLLSAPDVMLLDEPSNHLDIAATRWLEDYLAAQCDEAMLLVSHEPRTVAAFCDRALVLDGGRIVFDGAPPEAAARYVDLSVAADRGQHDAADVRPRQSATA